MQAPNLNNLDLNLLRVFDAIFREGNILRAARRLGMSQPAASHALARLRHALKDDLFVRSAHGMLPTFRAEQLAEPVRRALNYLELGLQSGPFDPLTSTQTFRLALDNCSAIALTARILEEVGRAAPSVSLDVRPSGTIDVDRMIDASDLDMFVGRPGEERERFASEQLSSGNFVVMHRAGIREGSADAPMTLSELTARPHLHLSSTGDDTAFVDQWLAGQGTQREVRHSVPLVGCVGLLDSHDVLIVARRPIAEALCRGPTLAISDLPFASPSIAISMRWHRRVETQPAHTWLRRIVRRAVSELTGSRPAQPVLSR
jgi:DNA-binding transcriptional LysR family regulator